MTKPKRLTPLQAQALIRKKWDAHHAKWLVSPVEATWPLTVSLHELNEKDVSSDLAATRKWVQMWRAWDPGNCSVEWASRRWSSGDQELPTRLVVPSAEGAAAFLGHKAVWDRAKRRYAQWCERFPQLAGSKAAARQSDAVLVEYSDEDFQLLNSLLQWFLDCPRSGLYLRQLPIPEIDTKWVEKRRGAVTDLIRRLFNAPETASLNQVCGLLTVPSRIRIRVLCPQLRAQLGGLCDIEAPVAEVASLPIRPRICIVVENKNTGIALPDIAGAVVFMGLGLAVDQLDAIEWIRDASLQVYWGDLDTHGFAALARARRRFPTIVSVLMTEDTLLSHRSMWVPEEKPSKVESWVGLSAAEFDVYDGIRNNRWGHQVRLEQERISWPTAMKHLLSICAV
jgi:hypothetical protein